MLIVQLQRLKRRERFRRVKPIPAIQFNLYEESGEEGYVKGQWANVSEKHRRPNTGKSSLSETKRVKSNRRS